MYSKLVLFTIYFSSAVALANGNDCLNESSADDIHLTSHCAVFIVIIMESTNCYKTGLTPGPSLAGHNGRGYLHENIAVIPCCYILAWGAGIMSGQ